MEPDMISLPSPVLDEIFSRLPIREAVRTSVLSSEWRYQWTTIPDLVFDDQCVSLASQDHSVVRDKVGRVIDHVLLLHSGPINKFKLSRSLLTHMTDINRWVLHLSRRSVNEFVLEIYEGERYRTPECLFDCQSLVNLRLFNCFFKPPWAFQGFRNLKSLELQHVTVAGNVFIDLISSCPLLERLTLLKCYGFIFLIIDAPNLQYFKIEGSFVDFSFKNSVHLAEVSIHLDESEKPLSSSSLNSLIEIFGYEPLLSRSLGNLVKFFVHLPHVRRLEIRSYLLKLLAEGTVPLELSVPCTDLNYLSICINFNDSKEISAALCLLRSSPNLQEL